MGIRLRYTGGENHRKRKMQMSVPWASGSDIDLLKGSVYDFTKPNADFLLHERPEDFERVFPGEDGYSDAVAPPLKESDPKDLAPAPEERREAERPSVDPNGDPEFVTLLVKRRTSVANDPRRPAEKVLIEEGQTFRVHRASAEHYMNHLPDTFEKVDE